MTSLPVCSDQRHQRYRAAFDTPGKIKKLGKTLEFHHSFFTETEIVDTLEPLQTRIDIGFAGD